MAQKSKIFVVLKNQTRHPLQWVVLDKIRNDVFFGRNVKKELIPKELIHKYNLTNLWIYNLRKDWRLLYTITNNDVEVLAIILDWMNHKDYERLFGF